ncbi:MAG: GTPase [Acholeplasma sp.]|nr:GTPase [Acholeplasma sp.]
MKKCNGCGIILQSDSEQALGYVKSLDHDLCMDCFNLKHYQKVKNQTIIKGDMPYVKEEALIVYVLSVNHLSLRLKYRLDRHFPNSKSILVLNHLDTLEKSVNVNRMIHKIREEANVLKMRFEEIIPVSALQNYNIDLLIQTLNYYQNHHNIYLVGFQNSGKSLLFKRILEKQHVETTVLSGKKPGLTQGTFEMPYQDKLIIDTPGIFLEGGIAEFLPYESYKDLAIETRVKPTIYQLNEGQSVYLDGIAVFSYLEGGFKGISFYTSSKMNLHRTKYDETYLKFETRKNALFNNSIETEFKKHKFKLKGHQKMEIAIADVAFIHLSGEATVEIYAPVGLRVTVVEALY